MNCFAEKGKDFVFVKENEYIDAKWIKRKIDSLALKIKINLIYGRERKRWKC